MSGSGSEADAELPAHMEPDKTGIDRTAFSIFIDGALTNIYNEASGRSKDQRALRAGLKRVLGENINLRSNTSQIQWNIGGLSRHHRQQKTTPIFSVQS